MIGFYDNCINLPENFVKFNEECSNYTIDLLNINKTDIYQCVKNSFEAEDYIVSKNSLLSREISKANSKGFYEYPSLIVKGRMFMVDLIFILEFMEW